MIVFHILKDNFDPIYLGRDPKDLGMEYTKWEDVPSPLVEKKKEEFSMSCITSLLDNTGDDSDLDAVTLVNTLVGYAINTTSKGRGFMEKNPGETQQHDYKSFPGKMDHTTAVAFVVGSV